MSDPGLTRTGGREATTGYIAGDCALGVGLPDAEPRSGWRWRLLSDLARLETGHTPSRRHPEYWDGDIPWIGIRDATRNHGLTIRDTEQHVTQAGIENSSARVLPTNTVCLSRTASVGYVVVMGRPMATSQDFVNWVCDPEVLDYRYLKYALLAERTSFSRFSHGTTHQTIYFPEVKAFHLCTPSLADQSAIADVLSAFDDKIEQNRRTARALERLARASFQAWFVDFEPVKAKAVGASSFPGMPQPIFDALPTRFVESDFGVFPDGWLRPTIGERANRVAMGPFGSSIKTDSFVSDGVPVIRGGNLRDGFVDEEFVFLTEDKADHLLNANAFPGDLVITHRGTLGQIGLIPRRSRYRRYVVSQSQMLIRPNSALLPPHFLYLFLTSPSGQYELLANSSQTGVPAISRPTTSVRAIRLLVPGQSLMLEQFEVVVADLFDCQTALVAETRMLAEMRDYLLPKLLSGEVRAREGGRFAEAVL